MTIDEEMTTPPMTTIASTRLNLFRHMRSSFERAEAIPEPIVLEWRAQVRKERQLLYVIGISDEEIEILEHELDLLEAAFARN